MDRPEDYAIQQLLDELAEVEGLSADDRELLLRLANTVVSEHDRWLHLMFRRLRERDRAREHLRAVCCHSDGCDPCGWSPSETCGVLTALADEPTQSTQPVTHQVILLDETAWAALEQLLEQPPGPNEALKKLMASKSPWEKTR